MSQKQTSILLPALLACVTLGLAQLPPPPMPVPVPEPADTPAPANPATGAQTHLLQLPNNPINEVITIYERLTGRRLVLDSNIAAGPNLSILVPGEVSTQDAIAIIESALLLNGYSIVPLDATTSKLLGPGRSPLGESIPLYADPMQLPRTEELASYFMLLHYISPQDALSVFGAYISLRPQGSIVAVPNSNAIVITDTTTLIRRLVALQRFIDVPGARTLTEFIPLVRADAEKVAETINRLLEEERSQERAPAAAAIETPPGTAEGGQPPVVITPGEAASIQKLTALIKVIPDVRTNRILVVAPENRMAYFQRLIRDLDAAVSLEETLERPLNFASAAEILPVLQAILAEGDEDAQAAPTGAQAAGTQQQPPARGTGTGASGTSRPDMLADPREETAPLAARVGKARIIADRSGNKIIVIGPPEARAKAAQVLDMLDRRPKQIYLSTIVGQLTLRDNLEVGFDYLVKFNNFSNPGDGSDPTGGSGIGGLLRNRPGVDLLPDPSGLLTNAAFPVISGLTVYGTIAETVDIYARFLASTGNFRVISRPVVYTANNKKAVISSGQSVPVPVSTITSAVTTLPNETGTALTSNIQYKDVVLKLEVIPLVNSEDEVTLTIAQQNDNIIDSVLISGNEVPVISTQELTTTITVRNRSTIVLGGLITEEDSRSQTGIPLLSSIPGVGYLFSNTIKSKVRRELIILIQPFIINDHTDLAEAQQAMREASRLDAEIENLQGATIRRAEAVFPVLPVQ